MPTFKSIYLLSVLSWLPDLLTIYNYSRFSSLILTGEGHWAGYKNIIGSFNNFLGEEPGYDNPF
jgi:hypothetical protein